MRQSVFAIWLALSLTACGSAPLVTDPCFLDSGVDPVLPKDATLHCADGKRPIGKDDNGMVCEKLEVYTEMLKRALSK